MAVQLNYRETTFSLAKLCTLNFKMLYMDLVGVAFLSRINVCHGIQLIVTFISHDI